MIIYESFLEKTPLVRKLLGGLSPPEPPPPPPYGTGFDFKGKLRFLVTF